jgi:hypothetical protein
MAGPCGLPAALLNLNEAGLKKLLKEDTPREPPTNFACPTASTRPRFTLIRPWKNMT